MSNMGLERYLNANDIQLVRTSVGDRYVVEEMRKGGYNLGGEQSGHIVMSDYVTTGDGLMAGLQFLNAVVSSGMKASKLANIFEPVPQLLKNVSFERSRDPMNADNVKNAIADGEAKLGKAGRLLIRASGTEPVIRVMGEADDAALLEKVIDQVVDAVANAA